MLDYYFAVIGSNERGRKALNFSEKRREGLSRGIAGGILSITEISDTF